MNKKTEENFTLIRKTKAFTAMDMQCALEYVKSGKSIREAARLASLPYATVRRYWLRYKANADPLDIKPLETKTSEPSSLTTIKVQSILKQSSTVTRLNEPLNSFKIFSEPQEITLATLFNGKNRTECRRIAYEMAAEWGVRMNKSWIECEMADRDWMTDFLKRLPDLLEKQYRNSQRDLANQSNSSNLNSSLTGTTIPPTNQIRSSLNSSNTLRHSAASEIDLYDNDTSNSNNDTDIVKMELNESEDDNRRTNSSWDKGISNIFTGNKRKITPTHSNDKNSTDRRNQNQSFEQTILGHSPDKNRSETKSQNETRSFLDRSNGGNQNHRQPHRQDDENINESSSTSSHLLNDNDDSRDSDLSSFFSNRSKKARTDDIQIKKKKFVKMVKGMNAMTKQNMDEDELFLLSLLPYLKRTAEKDKLKVKIKLLEVFDRI